jgi:Tfp pilus assembly protein PilF
MQRRSAWQLAAVVLGLCGPLACQTVPLSTMSPMASSSALPPPAANNKELPPEEAARVCLAAAEEMEKGGLYAQAAALYEKARKDYPRFASVSRRLAVLYDEQGDFTRAQEEYEKALKLTPKDADLLNDFGYSWYCRGNWTEAEKYLRQAVAADPNHRTAWVNLGLTLGQEQRYDDSLQAFGHAVSPAQAQCNLAFVFTTQGKREEARVAYRRALELDGSLGLARAALDKLEHPGQAPPPPRPDQHAARVPDAGATWTPGSIRLD